MLTGFEIKRQVFHIVLGLLIVSFVYLDILSPFSLFLMIIIGFIVSFLDKWGYDVPVFSRLLDIFEREEERKRFPGKGMIFLFIGSLLTLQLFDKDIALASIMVLALGDSISHLFGAKYGKLRNIFNWRGSKLFEGTVIGAGAGFAGAVLFVPIPYAFLGSFTAMAVEVVKIELNDNTLDDNLVVPLAAGTAMLLMRIYL